MEKREKKKKTWKFFGRVAKKSAEKKNRCTKFHDTRGVQLPRFATVHANQ